MYHNERNKFGGNIYNHMSSLFDDIKSEILPTLSRLTASFLFSYSLYKVHIYIKLL